MKTKKAITALVTILMLGACHTLEAANYLGMSSGITVVDSFKSTHPLLMVFFNIAGIFLLIGVCASVFSVFVKDPWDK